MAVPLEVNGARHEVRADPDTPLLWVLRGDVGDRSPKYGCGAEQCGSCRVLVGGVPTSSCTLPVGDVGDRPVTTPAGLAADPAGAAVQAALLAHNAGQCGYCLPGIAVTLTALVRRGQALDAGGVRRALDDHLCRCGAHPRIVRAALAALGAAAQGPGAEVTVAGGPVRAPSDARRLGSLAQEPDLDRWVRVDPGGRVEVRTGKVELGQGILTAVLAVAADELGVAPDRIDLVSGVTGSTPNEWVTAGSGSIEQSVMAVRQACAHARRALVERAAVRLGVPAGELAVADGEVVAPDGRRVAYGELADRPFAVAVDAPLPGVPAAERRWSGRGLPRVDLPAKVRGEPAFLHDLAPPGLRHARVVRPPRPGARLAGPVPTAVAGADVVRDGSFLAVVADREADAVRAAEVLARRARWEGGDDLAPGAAEPAHLLTRRARPSAVVDGVAAGGQVGPAPEHRGTVVRATYTRPFLLHGAIGPSVAVAQWAAGRLAVWSHSQGVELLRLALAEVLRLDPAAVSVTHVQGAGCHGHNGADDVALDAALVARAQPGRPVALAWTRADEHGWEPAAPAMSVTLAAGLDEAGTIRSWQHDVHTYSHVGRPRPTGGATSGLLAAWDLDPPCDRPPPAPSRGFHSGGYRNADPLYGVGERRVVEHFVADAPLRTSSTRSLGAFANVFALESFVDELALAAGRDPVAFRLAHLDDPRARAVIEAVVDLAGGLEAPGGIDAPGRGLAFARYENLKAYAAVIAEVTVDPRTGAVVVRRGWIAADAGEVIDPDGLVNQLEGGFVQAASWALVEKVEPGESGRGGGRPVDWDGYPILRFAESPGVATRVLDRPDGRPLGAGEATTGPTAAAIANAVCQATGARIRDLPLRPARVRAALAALL
jgi:CO/xanthine dehydrogenase Mo-binding subunit/aerobic-type carbon monoxide dehydrogenase small subunit (CoxS/CutS family)